MREQRHTPDGANRRSLGCAIALLWWAPIGRTVPAQAAPVRPDYDVCCARKLQLLRDGSFEEMDRTGDRLAAWGVYKTVRTVSAW